MFLFLSAVQASLHSKSTILPLARLPSLLRPHFADSLPIVRQGAFLLKACQFSARAEFKFPAQLIETLQYLNHSRGSLVGESKIVAIHHSHFSFTLSDQLRITGSEQTQICRSTFTSASESAVVAINNVRNASVNLCNFTDIATSGAVVAAESSLVVENSVFRNTTSENGGAILYDGPFLHINFVDSAACKARDSGGAFFIASGSVRLNFISFSHNSARKGSSVFSKVFFLMDTACFTGYAENEIEGRYVGGNLTFSAYTIRLFARPTPPATATTPPQTPSQTAMISGVEAADSDSTGMLPGMLTIIIVLVTFVIIISIIAICYIRTSRSKNTIYAGEAEERTKMK
jgi:hypothetical protein